MHAVALQYVRKVSGFTAPSKANRAVFMQAVDEIEAATARLLDTLQSKAPLRGHVQRRKVADDNHQQGEGYRRKEG